MDIRTKLIFALVAVSLASMLALGAFAFDAARNLLRDLAVRQLDAVAESKKQDLDKVIVAWRDRVQLITSRTYLRLRLREFQKTEDPAAARDIERIVGDAAEAVPSLRGITVFAADGREVVSVGSAPDAQAIDPIAFWAADSPLVYQNVSLDDEGQLQITFVAPIRLNGTLIGAAKVLHSAQELVAITEDYTGLGETGETLMALRTERGDALILNPLRHDPDASLHRVVEDVPTVAAVNGETQTFQHGVRDYRGEEVWAATRHLDAFDWGLVVKVDTAEELLPVVALRQTMWRLAVSLSAFAIVAGTVLGLYFARPIRALAEVARRIGEGELDVRAEAGADDEIGVLARAFNRMAEALVRANRELERRVRQGTP
jgi:HAMP domain-containing protein